MKHCKTLLVFIALCLFVTVTSCTGGNANHEHAYTDWTITKNPTLTAEGEAYRVCNCTDREEIIVPSLSDETVWTFVGHADPTCSKTGGDTYESEYGTVVVKIATVDHEYGEWKITAAPTLDAKGKAQRVCVFGETQTMIIAELSDSMVWQRVEHTPSTCTEHGSSTYTSEYGSVTIELELAEHTYGKWVMDEEPTLTEEGKAHHVCECTHVEETVVPALTDETTWEVSEFVEPSYNEVGSKTYSSEFGNVVITVAKKVAPYDGKTYSAVAFDADDNAGGFEFGEVNCETAWNHAYVTLNENGTGLGTGFPFRGIVSIVMINEETGEVEITVTDIQYDENGDPVVDEDGNVIPNPEKVSTTRGYVDFESGIIIRPFNYGYNDVLVLIPFEVGVTGESAQASAWKNTMVIDYTFEEETYTMMIHNNKVYFGLTVVDGAGVAVAAADAYKSQYVYVENEEGVVVGFVNNGEELVVVDGFEGIYENEEHEMVVSGYGVVTIDEVEGTYVVLENSEYDLGVYINNEYYEVKLAEGAYEAVKPMVEVSFEAGEYASVEAVSVNKNIVCELPVPTSETMLFTGWFYDAELTQEVATEFVPTVDVKLYAAWKVKVFVNLVGVLEGDAEVIVLGEGEAIGSALPQYGLELEAGVIFKGWYLDAEFVNALPESAEVTKEDSNITIYAKWAEIPAYYGSYKGTEIWNAGYGNRSTYEVTIDENGNISGKASGTVVSYDPETQTIVWAKSNSSSTYKMWFDEASGVLILDYYNRDYISNDIYIFSKHQTQGPLAASYAVKCNLNESSTSNGYYAHFVNIMTAEGPTEVFIYDSTIHTNFTAVNTKGEAVTAADIKYSKDVVVRDVETNEIIFAVSSIGVSFHSNNTTVTLDKYFGTYTNGTETIVLDGSGNITVVGADKEGTYTKVEGAEYMFDVYLEDNTEYYQLSVANGSFTMVFPVVELTFEVGAGHTPIASQEFNMNVPAELPSGEDEGYVFNGWFLDAEFTTPVPENYKPTADATIYAKYSAPAVLTVVYNNGEANGEFVYSVGDVVTVEMPVYTKFAFVGWYTTNDFVEGTEWEDGVEISEDLTIYAKWEVAPVYNNTYVPTEIEGNKETGKASAYTWSGAKVEIDPYGKGNCTAYPFRGENEITDYNEETGTLLYHVGSSVYRGFIDAATGLMVLNVEYGETTPLEYVFVVSPFETRSLASVIKASYWNAGATICINYPYDGTDYTMFVFNDTVYFNVEFVDAAGNAVNADACYQTPVLFVKDANGEVIGKFGYDGETMQLLDGYEGTYANGADTLVLDGVRNVQLNGVGGTYSKAAEGAAYTFDVYVANTFYEVTVNKADMTYTIVKPEVTISFDTDEKANADAVTVNKNIVITLPTVDHDEFIFRGWYADAELTTPVEMDYVPTESCTLYAKWDAKVQLTVVYGNGLEDAVLNYGIGDVTSPVEPVYTNGQVFDGWYLDAECTTPYEIGAITESMTIYCKWISASAFYGQWAGANIYGQSSSGGTSSGGYTKSVNVTTEGYASGAKSGNITEYDPATGTFKYGSSYGHYDAENGVMVTNYGSTSTGIVADMYVFIKGATSASASSASSYWNGGKSRIATFTLSGHKQSTMTIFVHEDKVYGNVTFTSSTSGVTAYNAYKAADLTVYDCHGNVIATFVKGSSCLVNA